MASVIQARFAIEAELCKMAAHALVYRFSESQHPRRRGAADGAEIEANFGDSPCR